MNSNHSLARIEEKRLLPVAVIDTIENGLKLAEALIAGGLDIIEVTLRTEVAEPAIQAIIREFPDMVVGAGTIIDPERVQALVDMGVQFGVAPGLNEKTIEAAQKAGLPMTPGVITPSEVERAMGLGCKTLKFFPAEAAGGAKMLKSLAGPYGHTGIKFVPTGGIDAEKAKDYWAIPQVAAVGGSWFVSAKYMKNGQWGEISKLTASALALAKG